RAPPRNVHGRSLHLAELAARHDLASANARRAEAVLEPYGERASMPFGGADKLLGARHRDVERLFDKQMLAGCQRLFRQFQMRVGRRQKDHGIDFAPRKRTVDVGRRGERIALCEITKAGVSARSRPNNLDRLVKIDETPGMRIGSHSHADHRHAQTRHPYLLWIMYADRRQFTRLPSAPTM